MSQIAVKPSAPLLKNSVDVVGPSAPPKDLVDVTGPSAPPPRKIYVNQPWRFVLDEHFLYYEMKVKFSLANSFVHYQACSFSCNPSYATFNKCMDSCDQRLRVFEDETPKAFKGL